MTATQQQSRSTGPGSGASKSDTYSVTPTSGRLLYTALSVDKDAGTITVPTNFIEIGSHYSSGSISGSHAYKVSDGTEGVVTWNWVNGNNSVQWLAEYSGIDTLDVQASADSGASSVTSQTTGTTSTTAIADSHAFAIWGVDSFTNADGGRAYTNSFIEQIALFASGGTCGLVGADKALSSTGTQECTFSTTDSGDQMYGKIAVFNLAAGASVEVGVLTEVDTLLSLTHSKSLTVGVLSEVDTLLPISTGLQVVVGVLAEIDSLLPLAHSKSLAVGVLAETNSVLPLSYSKSLTIGVLTEADTLFPISFTQPGQVTVGVLSEVNTLLPLTAFQVPVLGVLTSTESLFPLSFSGGAVIFYEIENMTLYPEPVEFEGKGIDDYVY